MDLPQTIIRASGLNQVGKTTSLNFETVPSIKKKQNKKLTRKLVWSSKLSSISQLACVCVQNVIVCWCPSKFSFAAKKPSLARRLCFFCPLKIVKSVWFEISLLTVQTLFHYYTYCQVTTQQPTSRQYDREKGVCCGLLHLIWKQQN